MNVLSLSDSFWKRLMEAWEAVHLPVDLFRFLPNCGITFLKSDDPFSHPVAQILLLPEIAEHVVVDITVKCLPKGRSNYNPVPKLLKWLTAPLSESRFLLVRVLGCYMPPAATILPPLDANPWPAFGLRCLHSRQRLLGVMHCRIGDGINATLSQLHLSWKWVVYSTGTFENCIVINDEPLYWN